MHSTFIQQSGTAVLWIKGDRILEVSPKAKSFFLWTEMDHPFPLAIEQVLYKPEEEKVKWAILQEQAYQEGVSAGKFVFKVAGRPKEAQATFTQYINFDGSLYFYVQLSEVKFGHSKQNKISRRLEAFEHLLSSQSVAFLQTDENGRITDINPLMLSWLGYEEESHLILKPIGYLYSLDELHGSTLERSGNTKEELIFQYFLASQSLESKDWALVKKNKELLPVRQEKKNLYDAHGNFKGFFLVFHEIIKELEVRHQKRAAELIFQSLIENFPFSMQIFDKSGVLRYANQSYRKLWHLEAKRVVGSYVLFDDKQYQEEGLTDRIKEVLEQKIVALPLMVFDPRQINDKQEGRPRWVKSVLLPILDAEGGFSRFVMVQIDYTELKDYEDNLEQTIDKRTKELQNLNEQLNREIRLREKAEKEIYQAADEFRKLAEASPDVIMKFDRQLRHLYVNSKVEEQTGIPVQDFIGKTHEELGFPAHLIEIWEEALVHVLEHKEPNRSYFKLPNGIHIDWMLTPEFDESGEVAYILASARDITELKEVQNNLLYSQSQLLDALKIANLSTWEIEVNSQESLLNPGFCELVGIPKNADGQYPERIKNQDYLNKYVHPDDAALILEGFAKAMKAKDADYRDLMEYRLNRKVNGKPAYLLISARVRMKDGEVSSVYGTAQDISLIKANQLELENYRQHLEEEIENRTQELKKSEEQLKDAVHLAKLGVWEYQFEKDQYFFQAEMMEEYGFVMNETGELIIAKEDFFQLIHPDYREYFMQHVEMAIKATSEDYLDHFEYQIATPKGDFRYLFVSVKIEMDAQGKHVRHYGTIQDITALKEAESEKERLVSILEATPDIVTIIGLDGSILYFNASAKDFYRIQDHELPSYNILDLYPLNYFEKEIQPIFRKVDSKGLFTGETTLFSPDGLEIPVSQVVIGHHNDKGEVMCYSTIIRNMTEQKKIERDLKYKNKELDTFVYRASHDLRGPIASLLGLHNLASIEVKDPHALSFLEMYHKQISRLNSVVVDLLELTKIKEKETRKELIDFVTIIGESVESFTQLKNFQQIAFKMEVDKNLHFESDRSLIATIIQNLIENAIKYANTDVEAFVAIKVNKEKSLVKITVEDNGIGMSPEVKDRIFDMFFRASEKEIGSGLGLYILKNAIEKLGGTVEVESEPFKGSKFTVRLPFQI